VRPVGELMADIRRRSLENTTSTQVQPEKKAEASAISSPLRIEPTISELPVVEDRAPDPKISEEVNIPTLTERVSEAEYLATVDGRNVTTITDPSTDTEKVVASTDASMSESLPVEAEGGDFETLLTDAFSGKSPEAARELSEHLTALIEAHEKNLDALDVAVAGNPRQERTLDQFHTREMMQRAMKNSIDATLLALAAGDTVDEADLLAQQDTTRDLKKYLDKDAARLQAKFADVLPAVSTEKSEKEVVAESGVEKSELPEGPEDAAYDSLKENWKALRTVYEEQEHAYHEALRTELDIQAKSWNPLKSIPYAARKMFGFNQKLSPELEAMKADATTGAMLYRDASQALAEAKRDALTKKFADIDLGDEKVTNILARHERMLGRKLVLTRAQEQLRTMQQASSVAEHPRMQKAMEILANNKYKVMVGTVGVAMLSGAFLPVLAAMGAGVAVRKGLGGKIESLLKQASEKAGREAGVALHKERAGFATYDDTLAATEQALEKEAMAKKHPNYTNAAAFGGAVLAGGIAGGMTYESSAPTGEAMAAPEAAAPQATPETPEPVALPEVAVTPVPEAADVTPVATSEVPMTLPSQEAILPLQTPEAIPTAPLTPDMNIYAIQPGDTLWDLTKTNLTTEAGAPTDTDLMGFRNYLASNPAVLDEIGVHTGNPDIIRPGMDSIDLQKLESAYAQYTESITPQPEAAPAIEASAPEVVPASQTESVPVATEVESVSAPEAKFELPLDSAIINMVQDIETFNVEKPGFLGLFSTTELQTTSGQLFDTMKDLPLSDVEKIYTDQAFRAQVFPNGVSQEALTRWVNWIQEQNATIPAYTNLTLHDYVASVAASRNQ